MALITLTRASQRLQNQMRTTVVLPDQLPDRPLRTVWLFHGLGDDGSGWQRKTAIEPLAVRDNVAVVMPEMDRSFYQNEVTGAPYYDYLTQELIPTMRKLLPLDASPDNNIVAGNSMGGFGAMMLAAAHPDWFSAVVAISPVVDLGVVPSIMPDYRRVFGEKVPADQLRRALKQADQAALQRMRWYHTIGDSDFMKQANDAFNDFLTHDLGLGVTYQTGPGEHDWFFWNQALAQAWTWLFDSSKEHNNGKHN
ncbi:MULTISPECIES: alpha/beta hydrolase family protein [unclassified Lacticaseibacillus]|uniref:alpha/beta hydrolase n=1 Tax=unclassified Lacticaseibacillus TaxID=2759744 RepID=UPI001943CBCA|nr:MULTISPECIES: alpha/beta fold hydrolase [unclassified Lacticaseibacillus]